MLYDFYAPLLTEKQQKYLQYYFHENYSLAEIAEQFDISRQAVYEHIRRSEAALEEYEQRLQLLASFEKRSVCLKQIEQIAASLDDDTANELLRLVQEIKQS